MQYQSQTDRTEEFELVVQWLRDPSANSVAVAQTIEILTALIRLHFQST